MQSYLSINYWLKEYRFNKIKIIKDTCPNLYKEYFDEEFSFDTFSSGRNDIMSLRHLLYVLNTTFPNPRLMNLIMQMEKDIQAIETYKVKKYKKRLREIQCLATF